MKGNLFSEEERESLKTTYEVSEERIKRVEDDGRFSKQDLDVLRSKGLYNKLDVHVFNKVFLSIISATFEDNPDISERLTAEKRLGEMAEIIKENLRSLDFDSYVRTKQYAITGIKSPGNNVAYLITRIYLGAKTFGFTKDSHLDRRIDDHCSSSGYHVSAHLKPMKEPMKDEVNPSAQKTNVTENICRLILRALAPVAIVVIIIFSPFALIAPTIPDARKNAVHKNKIGRPSGGHIDLRQGLGNSNDLSTGNPPENLEPGVLGRLQYFKNRSLCKSRTSTELSKVSISIGASGSKAADRGAIIQNDSKNSLRDEGTPKSGSNPIKGQPS